MVFFSIIIPTFNSEKHIADCLQGLKQQVFQEFEIIIQDGLSSDNTITVINSVTEQCPQLNISVVSEKDSGIYDAMNKGISRAKGSWLLFLGSDDQLYNERVLHDAYKVLSGSTAMLVYGNVKVVGDGSWAKSGEVYDGPFTVKKLFEKNICHQGIFYNRKVFDELGTFNTSYKICADWDFNHKCFSQVETSYQDIIVSYFHAGGTSMMYVTDSYSGRDCIENLRSYYKIGHFNRLFRNYHWVFYSHFKTEWVAGHYLRSMKFLLLSFYHANNRILVFKTYIKDIASFFKGGSNTNLKSIVP